MTGLSLAAVFLGGGSGAVSRFLLSRYVNERYGSAFPLGTFLINVSGCFALGFLASVLAVHGSPTAVTALLTTGFLGGYTTFSTYSVESARLFNDGSGRLATLNLLGSIVAGLLAAAAGAGLAHLLGLAG